MEKPEVLSSSNLSDQRFSEITRHLGHAAQFKIQFEISNFLDRRVNIIEAGGMNHLLFAQNHPTVGRCLIVKMDIKYERDSVKIDAESDYSEKYLFTVIGKLKDHCKHRVIRHRPTVKQEHYSAYLVFDSADLLSLDHRVLIPECGLTILVGEDRKPVKGSREDWMDRLSPELVPGNDCRPSGVVVNCVDPNHRFDKLFYCFGKKVFEIDIDRTPGEKEGIYLGVWNKVNELDFPVKCDVEILTLEEASTGKNPSGFKVFNSIADAENSLLEKEKRPDKEKDKDAWEEKEKKAKISNAWIKNAGEFIKSVLPTLLIGLKWLGGMFGKTAKFI